MFNVKARCAISAAQTQFHKKILLEGDMTAQTNKAMFDSAAEQQCLHSLRNLHAIGLLIVVLAH